MIASPNDTVLKPPHLSDTILRDRSTAHGPATDRVAVPLHDKLGPDAVEIRARLIKAALTNHGQWGRRDHALGISSKGPVHERQRLGL